MKAALPFIPLLMLWTVNAVIAKPSTVVGKLNLVSIDSKALGETRTIRVWLPADYDSNPANRYDVLYMQDGQNCFDKATSAFGMEWEIDETLTRLIADKSVRPIIVVGIDNSAKHRIDEFTFDADPKHGGGHAIAYADFVLNEVKPLVEKTFRTNSGKEHNFIGGSSLGALLSLEIARRNPGVFAGVIAMSPSIWWDNQNLTAEIEQDAGGLDGARIWIDMGTHEDDEPEKLLAAGRRLDAALSKHQIEHHFLIDDQHVQHNERAWASRFPLAIAYLLSPGK